MPTPSPHDPKTLVTTYLSTALAQDQLPLDSHRLLRHLTQDFPRTCAGWDVATVEAALRDAARDDRGRTVLELESVAVGDEESQRVVVVDICLGAGSSRGQPVFLEKGESPADCEQLLSHTLNENDKKGEDDREVPTLGPIASGSYSAGWRIFNTYHCYADFSESQSKKTPECGKESAHLLTIKIARPDKEMADFLELGAKRTFRENALMAPLEELWELLHRKSAKAVLINEKVRVDLERGVCEAGAHGSRA
ncbi:hypothetical protein BDK51DRAFT_51424 [Blyttiomyces helicus]|uniref:Uncharacterized protein n=1 Tax=Blyttiomyces helicus TaxID=388810 RepID=A0A4P9WMR6_9FUNG|nr:hypothetical protein BDK51DRAFT_51424 [Blyttiomyces helicus]|eukprot:RKO93323.1 hypothetical protein BDK51DRAFT_51424 [Blyttiomyces helicus]